MGAKQEQKIRGVNLGGWLVLEKWMTPSLFQGLAALDETGFCVELGVKATDILQQHWRTFITRADFVWLVAHGINSVRIPVGHWLFGPGYPYHAAYGAQQYPYVVGGIDILDQAFDWADELGLRVVLDLHAAPGCQNGFDNGGIQDVCDWHTQQEYRDFALTVLEALASRYHSRPSLHALEVLNEPRWDIPTDLLQHYTREAYQRIRKHCSSSVAVVFHDGFRSWREYAGFLASPEYQQVILDIHRYQCFVPEDIALDLYGHVQKVVADWKHEADDICVNFARPTYVGEWSLGLDASMAARWAEGPFNHTQQVMDDFQWSVAYRAYAAAQLAVFERYLGWYFWSYKTETTPAWCFRECVQRGWLPSEYG